MSLPERTVYQGMLLSFDDPTGRPGFYKVGRMGQFTDETTMNNMMVELHSEGCALPTYRFSFSYVVENMHVYEAPSYDIRKLMTIWYRTQAQDLLKPFKPGVVYESHSGNVVELHDWHREHQKLSWPVNWRLPIKTAPRWLSADEIRKIEEFKAWQHPRSTLSDYRIDEIERTLWDWKRGYAKPDKTEQLICGCSKFGAHTCQYDAPAEDKGYGWGV